MERFFEMKMLDLRCKNGGHKMHAYKNTYAEKGGTYLEICEGSSLVRTLGTLKKTFGDLAGAALCTNFGRA